MKLVWIILSVVVLDRISKYYIQSTMTEGMTIPVISDIFHITYVLNKGAAFGMLENQIWVFVIAAIILLIIFVKIFKKLLQQPFVLQVGAALMAGGAVGNVIDRILLGKVVDFLDFRIWPVFNVADIAICVGAGFITWIILTKKNLDL